MLTAIHIIQFSIFLRAIKYWAKNEAEVAAESIQGIEAVVLFLKRYPRIPAKRTEISE